MSSDNLFDRVNPFQLRGKRVEASSTPTEHAACFARRFSDFWTSEAMSSLVGVEPASTLRSSFEMSCHKLNISMHDGDVGATLEKMTVRASTSF